MVTNTEVKVTESEREIAQAPQAATPSLEESGPATQDSASDAPGDSSGLNLFQVIGSVFAAGLGVQSSKNRERDFKQGRAVTFIVAGLLFTGLFIASVVSVVSLVLSSR